MSERPAVYRTGNVLHLPAPRASLTLDGEVASRRPTPGASPTGTVENGASPAPGSAGSAGTAGWLCRVLPFRLIDDD